MPYFLRISLLALPVLAFALAHEAFGQSAEGLRPTLAGEEQDVEPVVPARPRVTRLEAGTAVGEEAPVRRRRAAVDPYAPSGIDAGAFRLFPVLETGVALSSNPALNTTNTKADAGIYFRPSIKLQSDWVRHQLDFDVNGDFIAFLSESSADAQSLDADVTLRLDVLRSTTLDIDLAYALDSSADPGDIGESGFDQTVSDFATLTRRMGKLAVRARTGARLSTSGETEGTDNSDLDFVEPELALRASYDLTPTLTPFIEAGYRPRIFLETRDRNGIKRSSQGAFAGGGLNFNLAPFWTADAAVNYLIRDFDDPALSNAGDLTARASVTWRPSDLTTFTLAGSSALSDSTSSNVSGSRTTTVDFDISHDLRENITLNASAGIEAEKTGSGTDFTFTTGADGIYRLTPWLALTAAYDFLAFDSPGGLDDYTEHRVTAGIELRR